MNEGYTGRAELRGVGQDDQADQGDQVLPVSVDLRGEFRPADGRFHWWGRVASDPAVDALFPSGGAATLRTPYGEASGRLSDRDPWGRYRITGSGPPPY